MKFKCISVVLLFLIFCIATSVLIGCKSKDEASGPDVVKTKGVTQPQNVREFEASDQSEIERQNQEAYDADETVKTVIKRGRNKELIGNFQPPTPPTE